jgi:hypothetical protein
MENVFRGIQLITEGTEAFSRRTDLVDLGIRPWLAGTAISAVTIRVLVSED